MRNRFTVALAALMILSQAASLAYSKASPSVTLLPLSGDRVVAVSGASRCDAPAGIDGEPWVETPTIAFEMNAHGTTDVEIDLTSTGLLAHEEIYSSSGNVWLDEAAMRSARLTRFTPELAGCRRIAGSYLYVVDF